MTDFEAIQSMNRANNGRVVVYLLFAMNAVCLIHFGGSVFVYGMALALISVAVAYLFEASFRTFAELASIAAAVASALCILPALV